MAHFRRLEIVIITLPYPKITPYPFLRKILLWKFLFYLINSFFFYFQIVRFNTVIHVSLEVYIVTIYRIRYGRYMTSTLDTKMRINHLNLSIISSSHDAIAIVLQPTKISYFAANCFEKLMLVNRVPTSLNQVKKNNVDCTPAVLFWIWVYCVQTKTVDLGFMHTVEWELWCTILYENICSFLVTYL